MTSTACRVCTAPAQTYLCHRHADDLAAVLRSLPGWLDELVTTVSQQAKTSRPDGGKATKKPDPPSPINLDAAELLDQARNGLGSWIRHLVEARRARAEVGPSCARCWHYTCTVIRLIQGDPPRDPQDMARTLLVLIDTIRMDEACAELVTAVTALRDAIRHRVDNLGKRWAGPCTATVVEREITVEAQDYGSREIIVVQVSEPTSGARQCGADLRTRPGAGVITCGECGATYNPVERARWIITQSAEHLDTAAFIAAALTDAGRPIKRNTITKWAARGKLFAWREDDIGQPLYRVGDVVDLLDEGKRETREQGRMSA